MTLGLWVTPSDVRTFANFNATDGRYSDASLGSNIRMAERYLQKATSRQWEGETASKTFTTHGAASVVIPDLRSASSVTLSSTALVSQSTYWLIPSRQDQNVYTGIQVRPFDVVGKGYLANPEWFDRNLDRYYERYGHGYDTGLPNDLVITGDWGWSPIPEDVLHAVKALAAFYTLRPDAVLANSRQSPDGTVYDLSAMPLEATSVILEWQAGTQLVAI